MWQRYGIKELPGKVAQQVAHLKLPCSGCCQLTVLPERQMSAALPAWWQVQSAAPSAAPADVAIGHTVNEADRPLKGEPIENR